LPVSVPSGRCDILLSVLTTNQKGAIAETAVIHEAVQLGVGVWVPVSAHGRYDLIFDAGGRLVRVQCKTAVQIADVLMVRLYSTRRCATGLLKRPYSAEDTDAFAVYSPTLRRCYLLDIAEFDGHTQVSLRLDRTRNNQAVGVRWARDYEFAARLTPLLGP
jgi:PD-(D/E)XK endonuclease